MKYPRILAAIRSAKWAVTPPTLQAITDALGAHMRGTLRVGPVRALPVDQVAPAAPAPGAAGTKEPAAIAVIPVYGILGKHLSAFDTDCGGCDVEAIDSALECAMADASVKAVVFDFDSPGGVVTGIPELAAKIREADAVKPCYGFSGGQCCSAAYWLASGCRAMFATVSADVGSIGVYVALVDDSEFWKKEGFKLELIKAGEFKAMGISGQPLADKERALIQADVDAIYAMFTADVRAGRGTVADSTMQGQTFMGASAVPVNLVDEIVTGLDEVIESIAPSISSAFPAPLTSK